MKRSFHLSRLIRWILSVGLIFFLLFNLMRFGLYLAFNKQGNSLSSLTDAFFLGLRYDLRSVSVLMLGMLILGSLPFLNPFASGGGKRFWVWAMPVITSLVLLLYMADFAHYAYLVRRLNASVLNYLTDTSISMNMIWESYPVILMLLGLAFAISFITWLINRSYRRIENNSYGVSKTNRTISFIGAFLVLGFFIFGKFNQYPLRWSDAFSLGNDYKANLALNPFESFFNTMKFRNSSYDEKKVKELFPVIKKYWNLPEQDSSILNFPRIVIPRDSSSNKTLNVVLVICESFSGYKSSMWGNPLHTTPFFDSLSRKGIFFDHCFTPSYGTARGVWASITGIPDVELANTASRNPSAVDQHTIMNDFTGHDKFYFIGGSPSWANIRGLLMNNIKDLHLYDEQNLDAPKIDVWGISDKNLFLQADKLLAKQSKPFIAVIQTADNHRPYTIPEEDIHEFVNKDVPRDSLSKYGFETLAEFNAFRYTDFCYQKFIEAARKENYFRNTIFVFIGDHGIPGNASNMFPKAWTEQRLACEHVPLLIYSPGLEPQRLNKVCSQIDVLPTIAGLCKISYTNTTLGRDLLDPRSVQHFAFIFDPEFGQLGVVKDGYFYRKHMRIGKEEMVSIVNNDPADNAPGYLEKKEELRLLSEAIYETSRWLLLNNKKRNK